jgi:hypothetical protein
LLNAFRRRILSSVKGPNFTFPSSLIASSLKAAASSRPPASQPSAGSGGLRHPFSAVLRSPVSDPASDRSEGGGEGGIGGEAAADAADAIQHRRAGAAAGPGAGGREAEAEVLGQEEIGDLARADELAQAARPGAR